MNSESAWNRQNMMVCVALKVHGMCSIKGAWMGATKGSARVEVREVLVVCQRDSGDVRKERLAYARHGCCDVVGVGIGALCSLGVVWVVVC
jgi:hypothetical protein